MWFFIWCWCFCSLLVFRRLRFWCCRWCVCWVRRWCIWVVCFWCWVCFWCCIFVSGVCGFGLSLVLMVRVVRCCWLWVCSVVCWILIRNLNRWKVVWLVWVSLFLVFWFEFFMLLVMVVIFWVMVWDSSSGECNVIDLSKLGLWVRVGFFLVV